MEKYLVTIWGVKDGVVVVTWEEVATGIVVSDVSAGGVSEELVGVGEGETMA